jgi:asparagine synthetase B (glutamine-hydrolysing)
VNGEFYDFERIRDQLIKSGAIFKTKSDSEILPHLFERKGMNILSDLRGEFSFVLWDENNKFMIPCRDRFGIKPLYYTWHEGSFVVASEIKALLAFSIAFLTSLSRVWDLQSDEVATRVSQAGQLGWTQTEIPILRLRVRSR